VDLADHLRVLRANWWKVLIAALIVGALSYGYSRSRPSVYEAKQLLIVSNQDTSQQNTNADEVDFRSSLYATVANTSTIATQVKKTEKLSDLSVAAVESNIHVAETDTTGILEVRATGGSPAEALKIANGTSAALRTFVTAQQTEEVNSQRQQLQTKINTLQASLSTAAVRNDADVATFVRTEIQSTRETLLDLQATGFQVSPLTSAIATDGAVSPHPKKSGALGFLVALVLVGEGLVIARAFGDRFARTNDVEQITSFTGLPVLAMVPRGRGPDVVEAFRTLRTNLMFLEGAGRPRTIAIVSPNPGAGKSFSAVHLAESAVAVDATVVLIDADLRRPVLHSRLRCDREPGLSDALRGADLQTTQHRVEGIPNLKLIPSGSAVNDTVGVLGGRAFRHVLDTLDSAGLVVVDTPPGAVYADALAVAAQCDATLLVLDAKSTRRRAARTLIDSLERTGATLIGVVVNNAQVNRRDTYERG
jgi:capsular exopolysaccharide synthesis family protein